MNVVVSSVLLKFTHATYMSLVDLAQPFARLRRRSVMPMVPSPALAAAELAAVRQLAQAFEECCARPLGGRKWFSHFEAWLWASRACGSMPVPVLTAASDEPELLRKLTCSGMDAAAAAALCGQLADLAATLRQKLEAALPKLQANPGVVRITHSAAESLVTLSCAGVDVKCTRTHLQKLRLLYCATRTRLQTPQRCTGRKRRRVRKAAAGTVVGGGDRGGGGVGGLDFFASPEVAAMDSGASSDALLMAPRQSVVKATETGGGTAGGTAARARTGRWAPPPHRQADGPDAQAADADGTEAAGHSDSLFAAHAFCSLARVLALQGGHEKAGGMQAACPAALFDCLRFHFGIASELFASPLNAHFATFCSAASDVDSAFGSVGSFFGARPRRGAYFANPPFAPSVVEAMARRMGRLLAIADRTVEALTFVVVIPHWPEKRCWQALEQLHFTRCHLVLPQQEHGYVEGGQQYQAEQRSRPSNHDSSVFFLQSEEAAAVLPVTASVQQAVRDAFRSHCVGSRRFMRREGLSAG